MRKNEQIAILFWNNVSNKLSSLGVSWTWLANQINEDCVYLSSLRNHNCLPSLPLAIKIAHVINISVEKLCEGTCDNQLLNVENSYLQNVFLDTKKLVADKCYQVNHTKISIPDSKKSTYYYYDLTIKDSHKWTHNNNTEILVLNSDCLEVAKQYKNKNSVLLCPANRRTPEHGVLSGLNTIEAQLLRTSNYYKTLFAIKDSAYPLNPKFGGIYSPEVFIFKSNEDGKSVLLENPFSISIIAVSAIYKPTIKEKEYSDSDRLLMESKIKTIFNIALRKKHSILILPAFGCGASLNPPQLVASMFKQIINSNEYKGCFDKIIFAIPDKATYKTFKQYLL